MTSEVFLIGDIGGTNARFALVNAGASTYHDELVLQSAEFETPELAIGEYLARVSCPEPVVICLAAAGPLVNGGVDFTNNNWHLREFQLQERFDPRKVRLLNDFEAVAYSLPGLDASSCERIGLHTGNSLKTDKFTVGVIGPGTGLGAAGLVRRNGFTFPLITEAGHVGFAPENSLQKAVWEVLRHRFGRVSDERLVSGAGLENIFSALSEIHDAPSLSWRASEIFAQVGQHNMATEAVNLFFEVLGQVAGNFALVHGAYDGIYIAGGIVQRYPELLANSAFRVSFENKGRHRYLMERIPTLLITHPHPGLLGAALMANDLAD
jgi:glucokinase